MRKYYTIEKTIWTSRPALEKMIEKTSDSIGKPIKIEKVDQTQKTFLQIRAKKNQLNEICR